MQLLSYKLMINSRHVKTQIKHYYGQIISPQQFLPIAPDCWDQLMQIGYSLWSVSPYKYYILIKTIIINCPIFYQHDWKLKYNSKQLKSNQLSTFYLFFKIYRFAEPKQWDKEHRQVT